MKYFRFDYDYVLWGLSYANLSLLMATIPTYESKEEERDDVSDKKEQISRMAKPSLPSKKERNDFFKKT